MPQRRAPSPRATSAAARKGARAGRRAVNFFRDCLRHTKGQWAGQPFVPLPWQRALLERVFGTLLPDERRLYRRVYVEVPKKNGKSALAAGIALYLLLGEDEPEAEIYSAAADKDQAAIVFAQAAAMVEANPELAAHVEVYKNGIVRRATGGSYRVLSADVPTKHGINASGIVFDELHAQRDRDLWDTLIPSTAARRQPLTIALTTAGFDRTSICWEQHEYARGVLAGAIEDPEYLAVIYAAEPGDDWRAPATWKKANPSLGATVREEYLDAECRRAQRSPAYENTFRRFHLNQWTQQVERWLPLDAWVAGGAERIEDADLDGVPAFGGLDLGQKDDFTAFVMIFLLPDGRVAVRARFWIPETTIETTPHRPYDLWRRTGDLRVTEGTVVDYDRVEREVLEDCRAFGVREVAFDKRFAGQMAQRLTGEGVLMIDQGQGFQLNEALRKLLDLVHTKRLLHGGEPVLAWMAGNMVVRTGARGEIRPAKDHARDKIDGIVALAMALDRLIRYAPQEEVSAYADHGLLTV